MAKRQKETFTQNFKRFFLRGLAILLPSILSIWLLIAAYVFIDDTIARPINAGVREIFIRFTDYPAVDDDETVEFTTHLEPRELKRWAKAGERERLMWVRRAKLEDIWRESLWPLNLVGVVLAVVLIYLIGGFVGSFIGRRLYHRGERMLGKVPVLRSVYPSIKQVTDFFVGERPKNLEFSRVVACEYPRKGMWSLGLVTGETMRTIEGKAGQRCMTIFIPSSPTPFTGYVITVPVADVVDLPITIDDAMRFTISGGVVVPEAEVIHHGGAGSKPLPAPPASGDAADNAGDA